jgi:hypothetical protein
MNNRQVMAYNVLIVKNWKNAVDLKNCKPSPPYQDLNPN